MFEKKELISLLLGDNVLCIVDEEEGFVLIPLCIVDAFGADAPVAGADATERPASI